jgi:hypothetical protein
MQPGASEHPDLYKLPELESSLDNQLRRRARRKSNQARLKSYGKGPRQPKKPKQSPPQASDKQPESSPAKGAPTPQTGFVGMLKKTFEE